MEPAFYAGPEGSPSRVRTQELHSCNVIFLIKVAQGGTAIGRMLSDILDAMVGKEAVWLDAYDSECAARNQSFVDLAKSLIFFLV